MVEVLRVKTMSILNQGTGLIMDKLASPENILID